VLMSTAAVISPRIPLSEMLHQRLMDEDAYVLLKQW